MSVCENCGNEFEQKNKYRTNKTCSTECRYALSAKSGTGQLRGRRETRICPRCGTSFECTVAKPKTYCTWDCMMEARTEDSRASSTCEQCGKEFTHFKRQDQRTCSPACRNKLTAAQREINYPECRECGVSTGSYNRIYCDEHRPNRPGRKPMPRKVAICQQCNEEFSRPGTWPGQMMFCSLRCSNEQHSRKRAQHYRHGEVNLNGSYELRFTACLARLMVDWAPWPDDRPFIHDGHGYRPDFLVNGLAIEVKGGEPANHPQRAMRAAWDLPERLVLVDREQLGSLERIFNRNEFLVALDEIGVDGDA
jgi:hypothetical protein